MIFSVAIMKICSWNVNWIRAVLKKGFLDWVSRENPDILCLQEVKAFETQLPSEIRFALQDYDYVWHAGQRPGYSGTAIFWKKTLEVVNMKNTFDELECFYEDGRMTEIQFSDFVLLNIYFPNWWERADGTEMLSYKLNFYSKFLAYCNDLREKGKKIISCGDFNICHREIDIARPKENENSIGFLPIEREELDKLLANDFVDVFRHFYPDLRDKYTRWSYRAGARPRNVWRRLDYFWVSSDVVPFIKSMDHQDDVMWSDHCPIVMEGDF